MIDPLSQTDIATQLGFPIWLLTIVVIWSLAWKGLALWKSARARQPIWFIVMLILNTLGILEILYIFVFSRLGSKKEDKNQKKKK